jgi:hypothetical protein
MHLLTTSQRRPLARAALLQLLCVWTIDCAAAIRALFAAKDDHLVYFTQTITAASTTVVDGDDADEQLLAGLCAFLLAVAVAYNDDAADKCNRSSLVANIDRRIGIDRFCECVDSVSRCEPYVRALQRPQVHVDVRRADAPLLDHHFAKMYKSIEADVVRAVRAQLQPATGKNGALNGVATEAMQGQTDTVLQSYKELIKRQDAQLAELSAQLRQAHLDAERATALEHECGHKQNLVCLSLLQNILVHR